MDFWLSSHPFMRRLYGGEHQVNGPLFALLFLSRLYGGEHCPSAIALFLLFLSRLYGGEHNGK